MTAAAGATIGGTQKLFFAESHAKKAPARVAEFATMRFTEAGVRLSVSVQREGRARIYRKSD